jgi:hypothetical protein
MTTPRVYVSARVVRDDASPDAPRIDVEASCHDTELPAVRAENVAFSDAVQAELAQLAISIKDTPQAEAARAERAAIAEADAEKARLGPEIKRLERVLDMASVAEFDGLRAEISRCKDLLARATRNALRLRDTGTACDTLEAFYVESYNAIIAHAQDAIQARRQATETELADVLARIAPRLALEPDLPKPITERDVSYVTLLDGPAQPADIWS